VDKSNKSNKSNHIKGISKGEYSLHATLQELEAQEEIRLEELLQNVQTLEESLQDLPSQEDLQAKVERLIEQMERELEKKLTPNPHGTNQHSEEDRGQSDLQPNFCNILYQCISLHHCIREVSQ
jgi:hypothetical protein